MVRNMYDDAGDIPKGWENRTLDSMFIVVTRYTGVHTALPAPSTLATFPPGALLCFSYTLSISAVRSSLLRLQVRFLGLQEKRVRLRGRLDTFPAVVARVRVVQH